MQKNNHLTQDLWASLLTKVNFINNMSEDWLYPLIVIKWQTKTVIW